MNSRSTNHVQNLLNEKKVGLVVCAYNASVREAEPGLSQPCLLSWWAPGQWKILSQKNNGEWCLRDDTWDGPLLFIVHICMHTQMCIYTHTYTHGGELKMPETLDPASRQPLIGDYQVQKDANLTLSSEIRSAVSYLALWSPLLDQTEPIIWGLAWSPSLADLSSFSTVSSASCYLLLAMRIIFLNEPPTFKPSF